MENTNNILIVDDVPRNIQLIGNILKKQGYLIQFALNGTEALDWLKAETFDLILMDVMMPGMDGFETCRQIKLNTANIDLPIIFLTARNSPDDISNGFKAGGVDYISKPFQTEELLARIKTHLEIKNQRKNLQELNITKDKFFSIIAHDLKNPFSNIMGITTLIQESLNQKNFDQLKELTDMLSIATRQGYTLLINLLDWSRSQLKRLSFKPEKIVILDLIQEVISNLTLQAQEKEVNLKIQYTATEIWVVDKNMLMTILRNLISNSIKYSKSDSSVVCKVEDKNNELLFSVSDTGTGLTEAMIEKIFILESNFRSLPGTNGETGTGLGLLLCKDFVEQHNGKIWVESIPMERTTFYFTIPKIEEMKQVE